MTGIPGYNHAEFNRVAAILRQQGHSVMNPAEEWPLDRPFNARVAFYEYAQYICLEADKIVLLPGWQNSLGVSAELALAKNCNLEIEEWTDDQKQTQTG